jgi:inner membrane protein
MSGTNHIAGGIVFTGLFCSFWDVNIFSKPELLALTAFFAILPDIDHIKSPIGKLFYPISKFLDRKYGHRTITHSLICYGLLALALAIFENIFSISYPITMIFLFSYISHLIFDMMTKQGVPLYYPFRRNACVIPGNPDLRLKSSDLKTETSIFVVFLILALTCQPLFAHGFWNTFNRTFSDLKHLSQESRQSENMLLVEYYFKPEFGKEQKGKGLLIKSTESEAFIFDSTRFIQIKATDKIISLLPDRTKKKLQTEDRFFYNISPDSLNNLLRNVAAITIKVQSTSPFTFVKENKPTSGTSAELDYVFNPVFSFTSDSLENDIKNRIELLTYELQKEINTQSKLYSSRIEASNRLKKLQNQSNSEDLYIREKATKELSKQESEIENLKELEGNAEKIKIQLHQLNEELKNKSKSTCSGYLQYLVI